MHVVISLWITMTIDVQSHYFQFDHFLHCIVFEVFGKEAQF